MLEEIRIGIDIGGTFTDFVVIDSQTGSINTFKLLSTPWNPAEVVIRGIKKISERYHSLSNAQQPATFTIVHGSTVATNAILERKGARTALIATHGFRDVLQIGRQNRPSLYDFFANPPPALVPEDLRFEIEERVDNLGNVLTPLDSVAIDSLITTLASQEVTSVAVCLLFSFLHPQHERVIGNKLSEAGFSVSLSSEILPEFREYERTSTTAVNAYVSPVLENYLGYLEEGLPKLLGSEGRLRVMQSNGGHISLEDARRNGVRCILSGPAGGVIGALAVAKLAHIDKIITFDMGGTSTDVALVDGLPRVTTESVVGGCPIGIPVLDIHTIGAGGGSIADVDLGGVLRVGPGSAGADPGPACYGRGDPLTSPATVTDANVVLGRLAAEYFMGGEMPLDPERAQTALRRIGKDLGTDLLHAAYGVIEVVNAHMERALRVISVERGYDPADFTLVSFGGAGGLHAVDLARRLGIPRLLISPLASTLSAFGMLSAHMVKDYSQTIMLPGDSPSAQVKKTLEPLVERGCQELHENGFRTEDILVERMLDIRYAGQSYELTVPWSEDGGDIATLFHATHQRAYGYSSLGAVLEIVNARVRVTGKVIPPELFPQPMSNRDPSLAFMGRRSVVFWMADGILSAVDVPLYRFERLQPGNCLEGPAVVVRSDTTVLLGEGDQAEVDRYQNLIVKVAPSPSLTHAGDEGREES